MAIHYKMSDLTYANYSCPQCGYAKFPKKISICPVCEAPTPLSFQCPPKDGSSTHHWQKLGGGVLFFPLMAAVLFAWAVANLVLFDFTQAALVLRVGTLVAVGTGALSLVPMVLLLSRRPVFLKAFLATALLELIAAAGLVVYFAAFGLSFVFPYELAGFGLETLPLVMFVLRAFIVVLFGAGLAYLSFTGSMRVRCYMGTDEYMTRTNFTAKLKIPLQITDDQ